MATSTTYASKDASCMYSYDSWSGHDDHHPVGFGAGSYKWRPFIYFPISFTGMTAITSAVLWLRASNGTHCYGDATSKTMSISRVTASWDQGTDRGENVWSVNETWNWTNRSGSYTTTGQASKTFSSGITDLTWYSVDITNIVRAWAPATAGGSAASNYGVQLRNSNETTLADSLEFYAINKGTSYRPYVVVTYETNTAPNAPATASMSPGTTTSGSPEVLSGLTPTFSGSFTDPDAGDVVSGVQVIVYSGTTQATVVWDSSTVATTNAAWSVPYAGAALSGNTTYNWIARQKDAAGVWSAYSSPMYFKPNSTPLAPTIALSQSPTSDILTLTPGFNITHNDPDTTDNTAYGYSLVIETSAGAAVASTGDITLGTAITTVAVTYGSGTLTGATALVPGQSYRWYARTKDANGAWSSYSGYATFTVHITQAATSLSPTANAVLATSTPTFGGSRSDANDTVSEVTVEIYRTTDLVNAYDSQVQTSGVSATGFSFVWPRALPVATSYQWRVKLKTATFGYGAWTTLASNAFSIDAASVQLNAPTGTAVIQQPVFTTARSVAFRYYAFEVRTMAGTLQYSSGDVDNTTSVTTVNRTYGVTTGIGAGGAAASVPVASLPWATQYQWRAKVSAVSIADLQGQSYGSYGSFTTDSAGIPTLTGSAIGGAWITTANPAFGMTRSGTDTIATAQVIVYKVVNGVDTQIWDSGTVDVADATTATITYGTGGSGESPTAEPVLEGAYTYRWMARYTKTTGPVGAYSAKESFYMNAAPSVPTGLSPASGAVVTGINPTFEADFVDADITNKGDTPTHWEIVITDNADAAVRTVDLTASLNAGHNVWTYTGLPNLVLGTTYKWKTRFQDSKSVWGSYSAVRTVKVSTGPTGTITGPSDESTSTSNRITFTWAYSSPSAVAQSQYWLRVYRTLTAAGGGDDPAQDVLVYDGGWVAGTVASGSNGTGTMPSGYTKSGFRYRARLVVKDADGLESAVDYQAVVVNVNAPPAMAVVSVAPEDYLSRIRIYWVPQEGSQPANFAGFRIYRRKPGDDDFTVISLYNTWTAAGYFYDYYAGNNLTFEYMVTQTKSTPDDTNLESPDSEIGASLLSSDEWNVVGADRAALHIFDLPVVDESHERPVQQEVFEPVGSNRKTIARGAVLGHEGTLDAQWAASEAATAKTQVEYLYANRGPHILKSPFGDVYEVEFAGPSSRYSAVGHLAISLSYIETSEKTSELG